MQLTFLGHAGFLVETEYALVLADPWLSPQGAFDSAWMQFPRNHHLAPWVREQLARTDKERFVYLSHEHKDHYDPELLRSLPVGELTFVLPRFRRTRLREDLERLGGRRLVACEDRQEVAFRGGYLKLYLTDSGTNRDSALLVHAEGHTFLDLNDCKIHDRLARIAAEEGPIDVFTAQYSGAIWHPTCYDYSREVYAQVSRQKRRSKFEAVARALEAVQPRMYLASAGPACFLDPALFHLNLEPINIFPRAPELFAWLRQRLRGRLPELSEPMPGDVLDVGRAEWVSLAPERLGEAGVEGYLRHYAALQERLFRERRRNVLREEVHLIRERLRAELERKLGVFALHGRVKVPLYMAFTEEPGRVLRVDFAARKVEEVARVEEAHRYLLTASAPDVGRVLERKLTWEDFLLSFRFQASRVPDVYDAALHNFLASEVEDLPALCEAVLEQEQRRERAVVAGGGGQRYMVNRYCPHQGADLSEGWVEEGRYLVCPRHRWRFDLREGGRCVSNSACIQAEPVASTPAEALPPAPQVRPGA